MLYVLFDKMHFSANKGDTQMTDYEKKLDEIRNNLLVNRNVILTGGRKLYEKGKSGRPKPSSCISAVDYSASTART